MALRVLVQPRPNFFELEGGDNVQLDATVKALRARKVDVDVSVRADLDLSEYDLVEIYNFGEGTGELEYVFNAKRQNKPVVVMPIYWNTERFQRAYAELTRDWAEPPESPEIAELVAQQEELRRESERLVRKILLHQCVLILPNSRGESNLLTQDLDAAPDKIRVIYNGAAPLYHRVNAKPFVERYGIQDFVLCVARLSPQKNQLGLVQAWQDEKVPLVLIGNDQEEPRYTRQVQAAAGPNTLFIPHSSPKLVASAYAAAKVHALVSWYEMMPLAALEAGVAGCNLVLTTETAGKEFFGDRVWYCEPDDVEGMRETIGAAYSAPRRADLTAHIRREFTWEKTAARLEDAFHEAIDLYHTRAQMNSSADKYTELLEELALALAAVTRANAELAQYQWSHSLRLTEHVRRTEQWLQIDRLRSMKRRLTNPR
jgi:glycosyltransferase involved in cell wall biosynthesis